MTDDFTSPTDAEDDILVDALRALINRIDPVPPETIAAARASFMWRTIDAELAELAHDSILDDQPALVRGVAAPALLTFESESAGLTLEIETIPDDGTWRLLGQLVPAQAGLVEIRHPGGTTSVPVDELGRFAADGLRTGPVSLRCRAGDASVDTDWFLA